MVAVSKGLIVDAVDIQQNTPLSNACWKGHLDFNPNLSWSKCNSKNIDGHTPLLRSSSQNHSYICLMLLESDAMDGIDDQNEYGWASLHYAAAERHTELIAALSKIGGSIEVQDKGSHTRLWIALLKNNQSL